jgi:hypothetical protein
MKRLTTFLVVALIASWTIFCGYALSQPSEAPIITFDDTALNDTVSVSVEDPAGILQNPVITFGKQPSGSPYATGGPLVEFGRVTFSLPGTDFGTDSGAIVFREPTQDPGNPGISDILTFVTVGILGNTEPAHVNWDIFFESDYLASPQTLFRTLLTTAETGEFQGIAFEGLTGEPLFVVEVRSDLNNPEVVPEPSTFLLLGAGLAGVGLLRRRFKK